MQVPSRVGWVALDENRGVVLGGFGGVISGLKCALFLLIGVVRDAALTSIADKIEMVLRGSEEYDG